VYADFQKSEVDLIESQMRFKMLQIQQVLATYSRCHNISFKFTKAVLKKDTVALA